jgi:hypothetical protein
MACALSGALDPWPVPNWWPDAAAAVDGVLTGPVSSEQLTLHPVAAGPAKVGLNVPRVDEVTAAARALVALLCGAADAGPPVAARIIAGRDSSDRSSTSL